MLWGKSRWGSPRLLVGESWASSPAEKQGPFDADFSRGPSKAGAQTRLICCASSSRGLKSLAPPTGSRGLPPTAPSHHFMVGYSRPSRHSADSWAFQLGETLYWQSFS